MGSKQGTGATQEKLGHGAEGMDQAEPEEWASQWDQAIDDLASGQGAPRDLHQSDAAELPARTTLAMSHLVGYGLSKDAARVAVVVQDTAGVPLKLLEQAMRLSRQESDGNFPPTVGQIITTAKRICQKSDPGRYRTEFGLRAPHWYTAMSRINVRRKQIAATH